MKKATSLFLNILRVIAVQLVLIGHLSWFNPDMDTLIYAKIGVLIFFILSGFLICTSILSKKRDYSFKEYFIDRFSRIYTGLIPCLIIIVVLNIIQLRLNNSFFLQYFGNEITINSFLSNLFMLQRYFNLQLGNAFPLWTLATEWWLYMFFGIALLTKRIYLLFAIIPYKLLEVEMGLNNLIMVWLSGAAIAMFLLKDKKGYYLLLFILYYIITKGASMGNDVYENYIYVLPVAVIFYVLLKIVSRIEVSLMSWVSNSIQFMADYSFTLYLLHFSIMSLLFMLYPGVNLIIVFLLINIFSALVAYFAEMRYKQVRTYLKNI